jgi:hypothetical protein
MGEGWGEGERRNIIMPAVHDRGGWPDDTPIDRAEHVLSDWERRVDAVHQALGQRGIRTTDEMRRAIESLPQERYESLSYYEKWTAALEILLIEKGILSAGEIDAKTAQLRERGL